MVRKGCIQKGVKALLAGVAATAWTAAFADITVTTNGTEVTVTSTSAGTLDQSFSAPSVETVVYDPSGVVTLTTQVSSTYTGGTTVKGSVDNGNLVRLACCDGVFGTGDVTLGEYAGLYAHGASVVVPNKINVTAYSMIGSWDDSGCLTLLDVGFSSDTFGLRLGRRDQSKSSRTTLSLGESSDAMRAITLFGPVALTLDGGVIKMADASRTPFFAVRNVNATSGPSLSVTTNGCAFSVPDGIRASLGLPVTVCYHREPHALETLYPANHDFEKSSLEGWGYSKGTGGENGSLSSNGSAFDDPSDETYWTTDGSKYMMLRCGNMITQVVEVATTGLWRMRFLCGCRNADSFSPQPVDVSINGTTVLEIRESVRFPFAEYATEAVELAAGEPAVVSIAVGGTYTYGSMNVDRVVLERIRETYVGVPIEKNGAGDLTFAGNNFNHAELSASGGVLELVGNDLTNATATAKAGGRLVVGDNACASNTLIQSEAGGALVLSAVGTNLVRNASFETDTSGWAIGHAPTDWTAENGQVGYQRNNGTVTPNGPFTPFGKETAVLRKTSSSTIATISQKFYAPESGVYRLSFAHAGRVGYNSNRYILDACIDGESVVNVPVLTISVEEYATVTNDAVRLTAGEHTLSFVADSKMGMPDSAAVFIDDVQLRLLKKPADILEGELRLAGGSTLELDYDGTVRVENVYVDGVKVNGGRAALQAVGVNVRGGGRLKAGELRGMVVLFR